MDYYHIWCDLKPGESDLSLADHLGTFLTHLQKDDLIVGWRLTRRKLGLAPAGLGEFHIIIEIENLAQLDRAFDATASRRDPIESIHHAVNSRVQNASFALYRDFPDAGRKAGHTTGQEKF